MDFGVVLQTDPPASRIIELAKRAEDDGFTYGWTFDSHILWQEPFVIYSRILAETENMIVGPMVTNPGTRAVLNGTTLGLDAEGIVTSLWAGDSCTRVFT